VDAPAPATAAEGGDDLERALGAMIRLAGQPEVFDAAVPALLDRALAPLANPEVNGWVLRSGPATKRVLAALAKIFGEKWQAAPPDHRVTALPALLELSPDHPPPRQSLWTLLLAVLNTVCTSPKADDEAVDASLAVFGSAIELLGPVPQVGRTHPEVSPNQGDSPLRRAAGCVRRARHPPLLPAFAA
jgi:hypothetical protein